MRVKSIKRMFLAIISIVAMICVLSVCSIQTNRVYAATNDYNNTGSENANKDNQVTPYATTSLSLSINGGNGKVWATVKNDFTLFISTVIVVVQLYSSDVYTESYTEMTLVSSNSIGDLNIGKTITTEAETGGEEKYWIARMRYKINKGSWESRDTGPCRLSATGEFLGYD